MNLIVSELEAVSTYVSREFHYIMSELIGVYGWRHVDTIELWDEPGPLKARLLRRFGELPAVILFWGGYELLGAHEREINSLESLKCAFADDLHWWDEQARQQKHRGLSMCDIILATYAYALSDFFPDLAATKQVAWIPHSASSDFLLEYNENPENAIFLSGALHPLYPLRCQMKSLYDRHTYPIVFHPHPGYRCGYQYDRDLRVGRGYAVSINKHRVAFTDCLKYRYIVAKYFEIPATGSLLLADCAVSEHLTRLGFSEGVHYIGVSGEALEDKIQYVLSECNRGQVDAIRRRGQELVWEAHKTSDRARLIHDICAINQGANSPFRVRQGPASVTGINAQLL